MRNEAMTVFKLVVYIRIGEWPKYEIIMLTLLVFLFKYITRIYNDVTLCNKILAKHIRSTQHIFERSPSYLFVETETK